MDIEKQKRIRTVRVVLIDSLMALIIVVLVAILILVVSGYRVKDGLVLEQAGLLQVSSFPSGAKVEIDGEQAGKTEINKMLDEGTYHVALYKDGYESWQKDVAISPGWLRRVNYARLLLQDRKTETVRQFSSLDFLVMVPDRKHILYADKATSWHYAEIDSEKNILDIDIINLLGDFVVADKFSGQLTIAEWNKNNDKVIVKAEDGVKTQWLLVNLRKPEDSVNISKKFNLEMTKVTMENNAADKLLVLAQSNLQEVDLKRGEVSEVAMENVADYDNDGADIIYVSLPDAFGQKSVGVYKYGDAEPEQIYQVEESDKAAVSAIAAYVGKKYLVFMVNDRLYVYEGDKNKLVVESDTGVLPSGLEVSHSGEFIYGRNEKTVLMIDLELPEYYVYEIDSPKLFWADDYMLAEVVDGRLNLLDFDGTNRRVLSVADGNYGATISDNNKYIYYIYQNNEIFELERETID